jgi:outer membrane lipoprotein carrier protein
MKKQFALIFLLCILVFFVRAQSNTDTENILDKAAAKIQSSKGINVNFSLTQRDKLNHVVINSKGILKLKGIKYYIKQEENEIFCNGIQIWNYDGQNEVTVAKTGNDEDEFSPQQILTGFNKKDFEIALVSSNGTNYQVQLIPVDKRKNLKQLILYINKSTYLMSKAAITDKTNAVTEINFSNISLNSSFPDSQFVFDVSKHPGVEVVNQ